MVLLSIITGSCGTAPSGPQRPPSPPKGFPNESLLRAAFALGMIDLVDTDPEIPGNIHAFTDIEYASVDSKSLELDIYRRFDVEEPVPLLIFIHGGSWKSGRRSDYLPYLLDYAEKGYVTATISYRLIDDALFPAAARDVYCALRWLVEHGGEYGADTRRIALVGGSAGAHLAMLIGYGGHEEFFHADCKTGSAEEYLMDSVKAIINFYGPVDLTTPYAASTSQVMDFIDASYDQNPGIFKAASPIYYITADDPPTLTFHGTIDSLVPVSQADELDRSLANAGVLHEYHRLSGWPHTMDLATKVNEYVQYYMDHFLRRFLEAN